jgi:type I restriction enzyme S subunit
MIKGECGELFNYLSETNITEQYFYEHKGDFPVYSGQTENDGVVAYIDSANQKEPSLVFTTYGSAGKLNYRDGNFTIGRNAMGLRPKKRYRKDINLKWFAYKFQNLFYRLRIGDPQGQKSLNKLLLDKVLIEIPDEKIQIKQLSYYQKAINLQKEILNIKTELINFLESKQLIKKTKYKEQIKNIFKIVGGNSGLTEEFVYYNQPTNNKDKINILSGATIENNLLGLVDINAKPYNRKLKVFEAPFIQIVRKGLAGHMRFIENGKFVANDDIYIIKVKDEWKDKIDLRWFCYQYQELFFNLVTSKSDNATFNKEYAEEQVIKIPNEKIQKKLSEKLLFYDKLLDSMEKLNLELNNLIESEII